MTMKKFSLFAILLGFNIALGEHVPMMMPLL